MIINPIKALIVTSIKRKIIVTELKRFSDYKVNKSSITYKDKIDVGNSGNISGTTNNQKSGKDDV